MAQLSAMATCEHCGGTVPEQHYPPDEYHDEGFSAPPEGWALIMHAADIPGVGGWYTLSTRWLCPGCQDPDDAAAVRGLIAEAKR